MKIIFSILILLSISFNVHSDTESPPWDTQQIFCKNIEEEFRFNMNDYNNIKAKIIRLNELIDNNEASFEGDDYYETSEFKNLMNRIKRLNEFRFETILPTIETYANIEGVFCRP